MYLTAYVKSLCMQWLYGTHLLIAMKLLVIFLFVASLSASAGGYGQITYSARDVPIEKALNAIARQGGYVVFYNNKQLNGLGKVSLNLKNVSIKEALEICLKGQSLAFSTEGKTISIITPALTPIAGAVNHQLYSRLLTTPPVTGTVRGPNGEPIPGANIIVKGTKRGAVTAPDGSFSVEANVGDVLIISSIGYVSKGIRIAEDNTAGIINLDFANIEMEEVVVQKGYYSSSRKLNTGSVGTVKAIDIAKQPVSDPLMALTGRIAGVYISQNSGVPGTSLNINIRGKNSLSNGIEPLYIVDGVPFNSSTLSRVMNATGVVNQVMGTSPFTNIRPEDIESIDVLKDADATAIYGSRGANGVILITTKKGKAGKTKFDLNVYRGSSEVTRRFELMNTEQYLAMRNEAFKNDGVEPQSYEFDVNGTWDKSRYTDWQEMMIGGRGHMTNASASISGGDARTQFLFGASYRKETTVFPGNANNEIASANSHVNHKSENSRFNFDFSTNYSSNNNLLPLADFTSYIFMAPNAPTLYDINGQLNWENNTFDNPFANILQTSRVRMENLLSDAVFSFRLVDNLKVKANIGYNSTVLSETALIPGTSIKPSDFSALSRANTTGHATAKSWIIEPQLHYFKQIGGHRFDGLVGSTFQSVDRSGILQTAWGFSSDALIENIGSASNLTSTSTFSQYRYNAIFARIGYNYKEKYVINLTGRRDGSSRFGPGKQFGDFGSLGIAWILSKENIISKAIPFLSLGKLRSSIGRSGNDQIQDYNYLPTYESAGNYFGISTLAPDRLSNPAYGWETIDKQEVALELGFFKDRILFNTSVYRNRTRNQLVGYQLPEITGFVSVIANLPAVLQNTGIEIDIATKNLGNTAFEWTTKANLSIPKSQLVSYPNFEASSYTSNYKIGMPLNLRYVYKSTAIDPITGVYTFEDFNKDGEINSTQDRYFIDLSVKFFGGITNTFTYKDLSLDVFLQFAKQRNYEFIGAAPPGIFYTTGVNAPVPFLDRWQSEANVGKFQKYTASFSSDAMGVFFNYASSDAVLVDASYIRLKNLSLSWKLPKQWITYAGLQNVRLYAQAQNLFTFTKFTGLDPEIVSYSTLTTLPTLRILTVGIQVSL
jgi:TonB-dependent starch-binding outer membrane protein SusC